MTIPVGESSFIFVKKKTCLKNICTKAQEYFSHRTTSILQSVLICFQTCDCYEIMSWLKKWCKIWLTQKIKFLVKCSN